MARAELIACAKLAQPEADRDACNAKLTTACFYAEHILPQAPALQHIVMDGADSTLALAEARF
jgi:hypothetical protein